MAPPPSRFTTPSALRGPGAVEILDEAASLLRRTPLSTIAIYFLGALPFAFAVLYFFADMAQSANAETRLPGEALMVALLYFWMKTCQAVFSRKLLALLEGEDSEPWTPARWLNTALLQTIYAGSLVIVYPLALIITIPFAWVNAFYHGISILATGPRSTLGSGLREAGEMAALWPKQNHLIVGTMLLAFLVLFFNLVVFFFLIPQLLNSFFGIETVFGDNSWSLVNSSTFLDILVFSFLLLNPLNKAVFVLRCFYGRARLSGADLRSELRRRKTASVGRAAVIALVLLLLVPVDISGAPSPAPATPPPAQTQPAVSGLDQAIQKTLQKDEFAWRLPRESGKADENGAFTKLANRVLEYIKAAFRPIRKLLGKFIKWLFKSSEEDHHSEGSSTPAISEIPWRAILVMLAIVLAGILAYFVLRHFRLRRDGTALAALTPAPLRTVDLEAENVQADELPEDSWLALAQQLIERGELRLALRAFYLATLASLARQQLVRLAAAKSNRDYVTELTRRLRGETSLVPYFRENVQLFEASWYGTHDVTSTIIDAMRSNQRHVQGHAVP